MKETINKVKAMLNMKSALVKALQKDLEDALVKIDQRDNRIDSLQMALQTEVRRADELAANYFRLQFINEDLEMQLELAKKDAEWWREQDEDEDYQASLEIAALDSEPELLTSEQVCEHYAEQIRERECAKADDHADKVFSGDDYGREDD